jgi:hypothetical protein
VLLNLRDHLVERRLLLNQRREFCLQRDRPALLARICATPLDAVDAAFLDHADALEHGSDVVHTAFRDAQRVRGLVQVKQALGRALEEVNDLFGESAKRRVTARALLGFAGISVVAAVAVVKLTVVVAAIMGGGRRNSAGSSRSGSTRSRLTSF